MKKPLPEVRPNTWEFLRDPMIAPTGFREYDARWQFPEAINLPGMTALGFGLGTQMRRRGIEPSDGDADVRMCGIGAHAPPPSGVEVV